MPAFVQCLVRMGGVATVASTSFVRLATLHRCRLLGAQEEMVPRVAVARYGEGYCLPPTVRGCYYPVLLEHGWNLPGAGQSVNAEASEEAQRGYSLAIDGVRVRLEWMSKRKLRFPFPPTHLICKNNSTTRCRSAILALQLLSAALAHDSTCGQNDAIDSWWRCVESNVLFRHVVSAPSCNVCSVHFISSYSSPTTSFFIFSRYTLPLPPRERDLTPLNKEERKNGQTPNSISSLYRPLYRARPQPPAVTVAVTMTQKNLEVLCCAVMLCSVPTPLSSQPDAPSPDGNRSL